MAAARVCLARADGRYGASLCAGRRWLNRYGRLARPASNLVFWQNRLAVAHTIRTQISLLPHFLHSDLASADFAEFI